MDSLFCLLILFPLKHFIFDFLYQPPYQWMNKGKFGHPGGLLHAGQHAIGTWLVLFASFGGTALDNLVYVFFGFFAIAEFIIHYLVDYAKMNINKKMGWGPNTHSQFWILLGVDQLLHLWTYSVIIYFSLYPLGR